MIESEPDAEEEADDAFEVWPENVETVRVFLELETQWRWVTTGHWPLTSGLDYGAAVRALPLLGVKASRRRKVFDGLRVMELAALPLLNRRIAG